MKAAAVRFLIFIVFLLERVSAEGRKRPQRWIEHR
jgi:hypothetical protein